MRPARDLPGHRARIIQSPAGRDLTVGDGRVRTMGVLNVTPDSFSDAGRFADVDAAVRRGCELVEAGADVLDIGGESTRPGHRRVAPEEQLRRVLPVLERLRPKLDVPVSIDTTRASVAHRALQAGADWINDTTALREDPELAAVLAEAGCPVVLMHRFDPPRSDDSETPDAAPIMDQLVATLAARADSAVAAGIDRGAILLDPGIGFGTDLAANCAIHRHLGQLRELGCPLVVGPSRKSFLGLLTGRAVDERLVGTAASVAILILAGAEIIRVHDVDAMRDAVRVAEWVRG